jgi:hypothetical protein
MSCQSPSRSEFLTTNLTSTGSTVPGIRLTPTPKTSIIGHHGDRRKSPLATAGLWSSTIPEGLKRSVPNKPLPKTILAKRFGYLCSRRLILPPKSPDPSKSRPPVRPSGSFSGRPLKANSLQLD